MPTFSGTNVNTTVPVPNKNPALSNLVPIPNMGAGGGYYDPANGAVYDMFGNPVKGNYNAQTGILTDPTGNQYTINPNSPTAQGAPPGQQEAAIGTSNAFATQVNAPPPPSPGGGAPGGSPGPGGGGGGGGPVNPFSSPFTGNPVLPTYTTPPAFVPPTAQQAASDLGFQFALQQGLGALTNSAAAQGLWASGATGKAMTNYAENYANQFYGDVYNRALNTYNTNLASQYTQPYQFNYQAANQTYQNQLALWQDYFNQQLAQGEYGLQVAQA